MLVAARNGNTKLVQLYLEHGADKDCISGADGYTPLMLASMMGNTTCVKYLLSKELIYKRKTTKGSKLLLMLYS